MSEFSDAVADLNSACLQAFGDSITYIPGGDHAPIETTCVRLRPTINTSSVQGFYFADIEVDPAVIANPQRKDLVVWADGTVYVVSMVVQPPFGMPMLALHRQDDK